MKKTIVTNIKLDDKKLKNIDRVYIGNDFCQEKINVNEIKKLFQYYDNKVNITLLLPFFTDTFFYKLEKILLFIEGKTDIKNFEIVFNDWGTFYYLRKKYPAFKLVMGRLLTKQKKDPRVNVILNNLQEKFRILKSKENKQKIFFTKKVPNSLSDIFSRNSVETKEFFDFLIKNNVNRIEIDNIKQCIKTEKNKKIKVSLYYPYSLLTLTRYCGALYNKTKRVCNKICNNKPVNLKDGFYIKANALFYKNEIVPKEQDLDLNNIDRIIFWNLRIC